LQPAVADMIDLIASLVKHFAKNECARRRWSRTCS